MTILNTLKGIKKRRNYIVLRTSSGVEFNSALHSYRDYDRAIDLLISEQQRLYNNEIVTVELDKTNSNKSETNYDLANFQ